jgi:hypothetical protein
MFPATAGAAPAARHRAPVRAVVVVLPLLPVMAISLRLRAHLAKAPDEQLDLGDDRTPRASAPGPAAPAPARRARGDQGDAVKGRRGEGTGKQERVGTAERSASACGGEGRLSAATRTVAPCFASHLAMASPDSPRPRTSAVLP